jgi:hypothetical protein
LHLTGAEATFQTDRSATLFACTFTALAATDSHGHSSPNMLLRPTGEVEHVPVAVSVHEPLNGARRIATAGARSRLRVLADLKSDIGHAWQVLRHHLPGLPIRQIQSDANRLGNSYAEPHKPRGPVIWSLEIGDYQSSATCKGVCGLGEDLLVLGDECKDEGRENALNSRRKSMGPRIGLHGFSVSPPIPVNSVSLLFGHLIREIGANQLSGLADEINQVKSRSWILVSAIPKEL